jgi:acetyl esterase/lipase
MQRLREYWHALRAIGVPTTLVVYAGEGHGFVKTQDERDVLERALRWFGKYLGPAASAVGPRPPPGSSRQQGRLATSQRPAAV